MDVSSPIDHRISEYLHHELNYQNESGKNNFLQFAFTRHHIPEKYLTTCLHSIKNQEDFCDWSLCVLVRLLHFDYGEDLVKLSPQLDAVKSTLAAFPFWPTISTERCSNKFCYWSENHMFMFLSSAHLYKQRYAPADNRYTDLLRVALRAKTNREVGRGVYEVLSQVYLPYTLCAMLNLIDFSWDIEIADLAEKVANMIIYQLALGTTDQGVSSLTASARHFRRLRERTWGHNINQLLLILSGISVEEFKPSAVTGFMLTSKYRPNLKVDIVDLITTERRVMRMQMNHDTKKIESAYWEVSDAERIPFYWYLSALLILLVAIKFFLFFIGVPDS